VALQYSLHRYQARLIQSSSVNCWRRATLNERRKRIPRKDTVAGRINTASHKEMNHDKEDTDGTDDVRLAKRVQHYDGL
jgi:hypothetical protein